MRIIQDIVTQLHTRDIMWDKIAHQASFSILRVIMNLTKNDITIASASSRPCSNLRNQTPLRVKPHSGEFLVPICLIVYLFNSSTFNISTFNLLCPTPTIHSNYLPNLTLSHIQDSNQLPTSLAKP